jgi:hypothetical protein
MNKREEETDSDILTVTIQARRVQNQGAQTRGNKRKEK